jgi:hypothetical protein
MISLTKPLLFGMAYLIKPWPSSQTFFLLFPFDYMYGIALGKKGHHNQNNKLEEPCIFRGPCLSSKWTSLLVNVGTMVKLKILKNHDFWL